MVWVGANIVVKQQLLPQPGAGAYHFSVIQAPMPFSRTLELPETVQHNVDIVSSSPDGRYIVTAEYDQLKIFHTFLSDLDNNQLQQLAGDKKRIHIFGWLL
jgi:hypothetical protein